jgi:D-alanine-D-alanine ligase
VEKLKVTILYSADEDHERAQQQQAGNGGGSQQLVCEQVAEVLSQRGHRVCFLAAENKIRSLVGQLDKDNSDIIFNVCESIGGNTHSEDNVASMLELLEKSFTGSGATGLTLARDKALAKKLFHFHGIKYPRFFTMDFGQVTWSDEVKFPLIVKPLNEDGSLGIDRKAVVRNLKDLMERISYIQTEIGSPVLIEEYIDGREVYVGVLGNEKPEALPIIEWDFSKLRRGIPRIATSEAKWDESSEGFRSPSIFPEDIPEAVCKRIQAAAVVAFKALELQDYGRVDFRLRRKKDVKPKPAPASPSPTDAPADGTKPAEPKPAEPAAPPLSDNDPDAWEFFLIEVNPNPYLDRRAELAMAAEKHGLPYPDLIERIIAMALERKKGRRSFRW